MIYTSVPVLFFVVGAAICSLESMPSEPDHPAAATEALTAEGHVAPLAKRSPHYDFGLGKRAYSYVSEYKRLPVYNFGLGKRSRPYSFGLGKRSVDEETQPEEDVVNGVDQNTLDDLLGQYDDDAAYEVKRARPYSFGLGKRYVDEDEKRARLYDFGMGKRAQLYNFGLGKRARTYSFGLGKRLSSKFNFGLGKRQRDLHRFSFGLGKRSTDEFTTSEDAANDDIDA